MTLSSTGHFTCLVNRHLGNSPDDRKVAQKPVLQAVPSPPRKPRKPELSPKEIAAVKASLFYAKWYPFQWLPVLRVRRHSSRLTHSYLRYAARASRKPCAKGPFG